MLTGKEALNAPKGCRELDPAAIPLELLQVMIQAEIDAQRKTAESSKLERADRESQVKERYGIGNVINDKEATVESNTVIRKPLLTYSRKNKAKKVEGKTSLAGAQISGL